MKNNSLFIGLFLIIAFCLTSCAGGDSKNANSSSKEVDEQATSADGDSKNTNNISKQIDEQAASRKHWVQESDGSIALCSENFFVTDRGENVYGVISFLETGVTPVTPEGRLCGLCIIVVGADEKQPKTNVRFDKSDTSFIVSFNGGNYITWPYFAEPNNNTVVIGYYSKWKKHIKDSETCVISFQTEEGQMDFRFNTKGFPL